MPNIGTRTSCGTSPRRNARVRAGLRAVEAGPEISYLAQFGVPSNYSLSRGELAAHIRQLRRDGWQGWEIRARFTEAA